MLEAGIERARAVLACVDSDAENIFATLTARELRPDIPIVARAAVESSERKLIRAGANEVVSPYKASGRTMASLALIEHAWTARMCVIAPLRGSDVSHSSDACVRRRDRSSSCGRSSSRSQRACGAPGPRARSPALERPPRPEFGDFSTNVAMLLAPALKAPPREVAERVGGALNAGHGRVARAGRGRGPGIPQPVPVRRLVSRLARGRQGAGRHVRSRRGPAGAAAQGAGRVRQRQPDRAAERGGRPPRRLRRLARARPRVRRPRRRARVLHQRLRHADRAVRPLDRGADDRRAGARGRLPGRVPGRARGAPARRGARPVRRRGAHAPRASS